MEMKTGMNLRVDRYSLSGRAAGVGTAASTGCSGGGAATSVAPSLLTSSAEARVDSLDTRCGVTLEFDMASTVLSVGSEVDVSAIVIVFGDLPYFGCVELPKEGGHVLLYL